MINMLPFSGIFNQPYILLRILKQMDCDNNYNLFTFYYVCYEITKMSYYYCYASFYVLQLKNALV
jgi:hypothetical protein